jgi:putative methyltransferase
MSFPNVERIVYSTCSIHKEENEDVVAVALQESNAMINDKSLHWNLVLPISLSSWHRRGLKHDLLTEDQTNCLIRVNGMDGDDTNGFFVSYFERGIITQTTKNVTTPRISIVEGVESIYNGEFAALEQNDVENKTALKKIGKALLPVEEKATVGKKENDVISSQKSATTSAIPKKKEKRMNWKRKQAELKRTRLQQKGK